MDCFVEIAGCYKIPRRSASRDQHLLNCLSLECALQDLSLPLCLLDNTSSYRVERVLHFAEGYQVVRSIKDEINLHAPVILLGRSEAASVPSLYRQTWLPFHLAAYSRMPMTLGPNCKHIFFL